MRRLAAEERRSHTFEVKQKREKNFKREVESIKRKCELVGIVVVVVVVVVVSVVIFAHGGKKRTL